MMCRASTTTRRPAGTLTPVEPVAPSVALVAMSAFVVGAAIILAGMIAVDRAIRSAPRWMRAAKAFRDTLADNVRTNP